MKVTGPGEKPRRSSPQQHSSSSWETPKVSQTTDSLLHSSSLQLVENCVCLLRNLSYQVHREVPGCERYAEAAPLNHGPAHAHKGGCFSSRKGKGQCWILTPRSFTVLEKFPALSCWLVLSLLVAEAPVAVFFHTLPLFPSPLPPTLLHLFLSLCCV